QSTMGHLINDEAGKVATALDPGKFAAGSSAAPATLAARIIAVDGENVILNAGSDKGVAVGMFFDVVKVLQIKDPDSGKMLTSNETVGKIQVISVTGQTAVAKRISGSVVKLASVQAEQ
ncbi:MAG: FlgT C-terminal domain-containing protein, partial [Vulcanimicrobiaceae bacterium]